MYIHDVHNICIMSNILVMGHIHNIMRTIHV